MINLLRELTQVSVLFLLYRPQKSLIDHWTLHLLLLHLWLLWFRERQSDLHCRWSFNPQVLLEHSTAYSWLGRGTAVQHNLRLWAHIISRLQACPRAAAPLPCQLRVAASLAPEALSECSLLQTTWAKTCSLHSVTLPCWTCLPLGSAGSLWWSHSSAPAQHTAIQT